MVQKCIGRFSPHNVNIYDEDGNGELDEAWIDTLSHSHKINGNDQSLSVFKYYKGGEQINDAHWVNGYDTINRRW